MKHYFESLETGTRFCISIHRDGTASFKCKQVVKGKLKSVTKIYKDYTSAKRALGRYTGGWAKEIEK